MKISSAACLLLLLRNAGGSNIRGSSVLKEVKEQNGSASIVEVSWNIGSIIVQIDSNVWLPRFFHVLKEISTQEGSAIGSDKQVYGDDASGADDAVQEDFSEPTSGNTQEASTFGIDQQV